MEATMSTKHSLKLSLMLGVLFHFGTFPYMHYRKLSIKNIITYVGAICTYLKDNLCSLLLHSP